MAGTVALALEGVLAEQGDEPSFAASKIIPEGVILYKSLATLTKVVLIAQTEDREKIDYWLKGHNLRDHVEVIHDPAPDDPGRGIKQVVRELRFSGSLEFVVESQPSRAARFMHEGVPALLLGRPAYTRPEFHPGEASTARPWEQVVAELDRQQAVHSEDKRVTADVAGDRYQPG